MAFTFERSTMTQTTKLGLEATPRTVVPVTKRLLGLTFTPGPDAKFKTIKARGSKVATGQVATSETSKIAVSADELAYNDAVYIFESLIMKATPSLPAGGTTAEQRLYHIDPRNPQAVQTYTIENGDATHAEQIAGALFSDFTIPFSREGVTGSGNMLGDLMTFGATPTTTGLADVPLVVVPPKGVNIYLDDAWADLGTTKLTRAFIGEWSLGAHQNPVFALDAAAPGMVNTVEGEAPLSLKLTIAADGAAAALITAMRATAQKFIRVEMIGPEIEAGVNYAVLIDMCGEVSAVAPMSDQGGVYAVEFTFGGAIDAATDNACDITLVTGPLTL